MFLMRSTVPWSSNCGLIFSIGIPVNNDSICSSVKFDVPYVAIRSFRIELYVDLSSLVSFIRWLTATKTPSSISGEISGEVSGVKSLDNDF